MEVVDNIGEVQIVELKYLTAGTAARSLSTPNHVFMGVSIGIVRFSLDNSEGPEYLLRSEIEDAAMGTPVETKIIFS